MSDDGQKNPESVADALAHNDEAEQEDATVQISKTELAAIRESASNPALTPDVLREINRRRDGGEVDKDDDPTQTFDRDSLSSLLEEQSSPTEEVEPAGDDLLAYQDEPAPGQPAPDQPAPDQPAPDQLDDFEIMDDLDEFSDADLRAVVFGDEAALSSDEPRIDAARPGVDSPEPEDDGLDGSDFDGSGLAGEDDVDVFSDDVFDDEEFDALEEMTDDEPLDLAAPAALAEPLAPDVQPADGPPVSGVPIPGKPRSGKPAPRGEAAPGEFRGAASRLLMAGALLGGLAMILAGALRFATDTMLTALHPAVAGLFVAVGVLLLAGLFISFLQGRSH